MVNPAAGGGRAAALIEPVVRRLRAGGEDVRVVSGHDAAETAHAAEAAVASGIATLVALGGDGLVHLALQITADTDTVLGVIPAGTGNDIARSLGLGPNDPVGAVDTVLGGRTSRIDLGRAGDRWFAAVLSTGFDSAVNERANRMRWPRGRARYNVAMAVELRTFRAQPFALDLDGERVETEAMLVAIANGPSYGGGMRVCPDAQLDDGLFDVMVLRPVSKLTFVRIFPQVYSGRHVRHPAVTIHRARHVSVSAPGATAYADGERLGLLPISCHAVSGAVQMLVP